MNSTEKKSISNLEEIQPRVASNWEELPLLLFTLFVQLAVGAFWLVNWMFSSLWALVEFDATRLRLLPATWIGVSLGVGMLASFAHLGTKRNAWRAVSHWRKSSLSREILFLGLFGLSWLFTTLVTVIWHRSPFEMAAITAVLGIGLIYNMSQVYRFPAARGWSTWRTNAGFLVSALLLGMAALASLLAYETNLTGIHIPPRQWIMIDVSLIVMLLAQLILLYEPVLPLKTTFVRIGLIFAGMTVSLIDLFRSSMPLYLTHLVLFLFIVSEEAVGRWLFYRSRT